MKLDLEARNVRVDEKVFEVRGTLEWGQPKTPESNRVVGLPALLVRPIATHLLRFPLLHNVEDPRASRGSCFAASGGSGTAPAL